MRRLTKSQVAKIGIVKAVYVRMMFAAACKRGVTLTADEVLEITELDDGIFMAAQVAADELGIELPRGLHA